MRFLLYLHSLYSEELHSRILSKQVHLGSLGIKKMLIHNILKAVALAHSGCNERNNEDFCWLLIVVRNEKLHIFVTCVGIDSLESHQTQRFYR